MSVGCITACDTDSIVSKYKIAENVDMFGPPNVDMIGPPM